MCVNWWHEWRDLHVLPYGGSDMMKQPAYILDAIRECHRVYSEVQYKDAKNQQQKAEQLEKKIKDKL